MSDGREFRFIVEDEDGNRTVVPVLPGLLRVGRDADNEVRLADRNVSRHHASVEVSAQGACVLTDLGSYNGVFVNGTRVTKSTSFALGDTLRIGDFRLELRQSAAHNESLGNTAKLNLLADEGTVPGGNEAMLPEATTPAGSPEPMAAEATTPNAPAQSDAVAPDPSPVPSEPAGNAAAAAAAAAPGADADSHADAHPQDDLQRTAMVPGRAADSGASQRPSGASGCAHLLCLTGDRAGVAFPIDRPKLTIGRTGETDIALMHRSISREHSRIEWDGQRTRIVDLDSSNGTLVNGETYQHAELHAGDVVELGHIKLRYVAPGEPCAMTAEEKAALARDVRKRQRPLPPRWAWLIGVSVVAGLVTVGVMLWSRSQQTPAPAPTAAPPAQIVDEATSLLHRAQAALAAQDYPRAQALATAALAIDPARTEAQALVAQATKEDQVRRAIAGATGHVQAKAWADAFNVLQDVPKNSGHEAEVDALMAQVRPELLRERSDEARAAIAQEDWDEAAMLCEEIGALAPDSAEGTQLKAELAQSRERSQAKSGVAPAPLPLPLPLPHPHSAHVPAALPAVAKRPGGKPAKSGGAGAHAGHGEADSAQARTAYAEGTRQLANNQPQKAIDSLLRCIAADKSHAMCYRALGIAYAKANNGPKAVHFYKQYLKVDPAARDAAQVQKLLSQYAAEQPSPAH